MYESCRTYVNDSHVSHSCECRCRCEELMSHVWTCHVTYVWDFQFCVWVMSHICKRLTSHVTDVKECRCRCAGLMSHVWTCHVAYMCVNRRCEVLSFVLLQCVAGLHVVGCEVLSFLFIMLHIYECHTCCRHIAYVGVSHVTHINESCSHMWTPTNTYRVASISRLDKILGLFC